MRVHVNKNTYLIIGARVREGKLWRMRVGEMGEKIRQDQIKQIRKINLTSLNTIQKYHFMWSVSKCNKQNHKFLEDRK